MFIAHRVGPLIEDRSIDFAGINVRDANSELDGETDMHLSYRVTAWFEPDESDQNLYRTRQQRVLVSTRVA